MPVVLDDQKTEYEAQGNVQHKRALEQLPRSPSRHSNQLAVLPHNDVVRNLQGLFQAL